MSENRNENLDPTLEKELSEEDLAARETLLSAKPDQPAKEGGAP